MSVPQRHSNSFSILGTSRHSQTEADEYSVGGNGKGSRRRRKKTRSTGDSGISPRLLDAREKGYTGQAPGIQEEVDGNFAYCEDDAFNSTTGPALARAVSDVAASKVNPRLPPKFPLLQTSNLLTKIYTPVTKKVTFYGL
jgi:hypothetical protein